MSARSSKPSPSVTVIVLAAGVGLRFPRRYKQFVRIDSISALQHVLARVAGMNFVRDIVLVVPKARHKESVRVVQSMSRAPFISVVLGGATRRESSFKALSFLEENPPTHVLFVDAARPMLDVRLARRVFQRACKTGAAVLARPIVDSLARADAHGRIIETPARSGLMTTYTPHCYAYQAIWSAHKRDRSGADRENIELMRRAGSEVSIVTTCSIDIKLTFADDLPLLKKILTET